MNSFVIFVWESFQCGVQFWTFLYLISFLFERTEKKTIDILATYFHAHIFRMSHAHVTCTQNLVDDPMYGIYQWTSVSSTFNLYLYISFWCGIKFEKKKKYVRRSFFFFPKIDLFTVYGGALEQHVLVQHMAYDIRAEILNRCKYKQNTEGINTDKWLLSVKKIMFSFWFHFHVLFSSLSASR